MSASALAVVAGLVSLTARLRARGVAWPLAVVSTLCVALSFSVLELFRGPASWRDAVAFACLGVGAWLCSDSRRPGALHAAPLLAGVLQPLWLPVALAVAAERSVASLPPLRQRALLTALALAALLAGGVGGGQKLLACRLLVFRESLVRPITDARNESLTLLTALAVLLVVALLARAASTADAERPEAPAAFWLVALGGQLLVLGVRAPAGSALAVLPLLVALAFLQRQRSPLPSLALAAALAIANGVLRTTLSEEPALARAERARAAFHPDDLLLFPDRPSFELEYYAERASFALADLPKRAPAQKPMDALAVELGRRRVWLAVDAEGRPQSVENTERFVWGVTVAAGGLRMRELRAITSASPCSTPAAPGVGGVRAGASGFVEAHLGRSYAPERAVDGDPKTEWLAAPGAYAWLDLSLGAPRTVEGLRLLDAQNLPYRDFETRLVRVELHGEGGLLAAGELALAGGLWRRLALRGARVECVRLLVLSHRGRGGGLAEVELY